MIPSIHRSPGRSGPCRSGVVRGRTNGFTLIELVVVLALIGALLMLAAPRYVDILERGRVRAQQANLSMLRAAIDAFHGDQGRYPDSLDELVQRRYLRRIPVDPVTESTDWQTVAPPVGTLGRVWDVTPATSAAAAAGTTGPAELAAPAASIDAAVPAPR